MNVEELLKQAQSLNKDQKYQEVIDLLEDSVLEDFKSADLYAEKALAYRGLNKDELCNESIDKSLSINPKQVRFISLKAKILAENKEYDKAIEWYNKAIEINPGYVFPYNNLGSVFRDINKYDKAIEYYNKGLEVDPKYSIIYHNLAITYNGLQ